jgi:hypothetical protein
MEAIIFTIGLYLVRTWGLNFSWRKMIWIGSVSSSRTADTGKLMKPLALLYADILCCVSMTLLLSFTDDCDRFQSHVSPYCLRHHSQSVLLHVYRCD